MDYVMTPNEENNIQTIFLSSVKLSNLVLLYSDPSYSRSIRTDLFNIQVNQFRKSVASKFRQTIFKNC